MKALTLHEPWATLVALGVKTIETRSWSTAYRGPLAIHAALRPVTAKQTLGDWEAWPADPPDRPHPNHDGPRPARLYRNNVGWLALGHWRPLAAGAVVATCTLAEVVPIVDFDGPTPDVAHVTHARHTGRLVLYRPTIERHDTGGVVGQHRGWEPTYIVEQEPYGDYRPGRHAWLLTDIVPVDPPQPARGRQGLWTWDEDRPRTPSPG